MTEPTGAELRLVLAKAKCFQVCGALDDDPAAQRAAHEEHRAELEQAYAEFQNSDLPSNPASGETPITAHITVESGVNQ